MSPIQQMLLGVGAVATKTYVDDVFSTYLYKGTSVTNGGPAQTLNNGIDVSGKGGLVWIKTRNGALSNALFDTVRGKTKRIKTNSSDAENTSTSYLADFKTNGFEVGTSASTNSSDGTFASWTFRKAPGFFTICEWTGNGSGPRSISHDLGSVPGLIMLKRTDGTGDWIVFHSSLDDRGDAYLRLNADSAKSYNSAYFGGVFQTTAKPTATSFNIGTSADVNGSGGEYIAYLFAGGESTAATARSVEFNGSSTYLNLTNSDTEMSAGTGDFTVECWIRPHTWNNNDGVFLHNGGGIMLEASSTKLEFLKNGQSNTLEADLPELNQWTHVAVARSGSSIKMFLNGTEVDSATDSANYTGTNQFYIGVGADYFDGDISNFRFVKGSAVYTSSFRPPTEPLTNITNTVLLCCNNSSVTGSTVSPETVNAQGSPTAKADSPFDDPAGFVFGDAGDQNVIKCGSYVSNASTTGPEIFLGFEPQWVLLKDIDDSGGQHWQMYDSMRGIATGGDDEYLLPNLNLAANASSDRIDLTPTGFKIKTNGGGINESTNKVIYMAIRRPDPLVQKPAAAGTDVFNLVMGTSNSDVPTFVSGFVTDFALQRVPVYTMDWWTQARLTGDKYVRTNSTNAGGTDTNNKWEYNNGWYSSTSNKSANQSWMWKRGAGFDVVTYEGSGSAGYSVPHSLNAVPEMIWVKRRDNSGDWKVGHHGLNGGTNPWHHHIELDKEYAETDTDGSWNDTAPTSTAFTLGSLSQVNNSSGDYIALLFASVNGISKCGFYTGNSGTQTITVGFQPRFLIIKKTSAGQDRSWYVLDTTQGWGSGNDTFLELNKSDPESSTDLGAPTSTGFTLTNTDGTNGSGNNYIYYCHS